MRLRVRRSHSVTGGFFLPLPGPAVRTPGNRALAWASPQLPALCGGLDWAAQSRRGGNGRELSCLWAAPGRSESQAPSSGGRARGGVGCGHGGRPGPAVLPFGGLPASREAEVTARGAQPGLQGGSGAANLLSGFGNRLHLADTALNAEGPVMMLLGSRCRAQ